jgi:hypothetical protein
LEPNSAYCFVVRRNALALRELAIPNRAAEDAVPRGTPPRLAALGVIPVKLLVDDDEPALPRVWQTRLEKRLAEASRIFEHHCRIRFKVAAVETWVSDDGIHELAESIKEFERKVNPAPARLAIGFTSQYRIPRQRRAPLGGTRAPLDSHILIREWSQTITYTERLEVLVHELGHYLGAGHSAEPDSVMRPTLGDHRSHARGFRIGFDPVNTLIMYLVGEEIRAGRFGGLRAMPPGAKARLRGAYTVLGTSLPGDPAAGLYLQLLDASGGAHAGPSFAPR